SIFFTPGTRLAKSRREEAPQELVTPGRRHQGDHQPGNLQALLGRKRRNNPRPLDPRLRGAGVAHFIPLRADKNLHCLAASRFARCSTANARIDPQTHMITRAHITRVSPAARSRRLITASRIAKQRYSIGFMTIRPPLPAEPASRG